MWDLLYWLSQTTQNFHFIFFSKNFLPLSPPLFSLPFTLPLTKLVPTKFCSSFFYITGRSVSSIDPSSSWLNGRGTWSSQAAQDLGRATQVARSRGPGSATQVTRPRQRDPGRMAQATRPRSHGLDLMGFWILGPQILSLSNLMGFWFFFFLI